MSQKIYIAGPMSGKKGLNFNSFDHARDFLRGAGWIVVSPADLTRLLHGWDNPPDDDSLCTPNLTKEQRWHIMLTDLAALSDCEAIFMLHGWETSDGGTVEIALATFLGLEIHFAEDSYREEDVWFVGPPDLRDVQEGTDA